MTYEHRLLVSFEEIKAIVFECNTCKTKVSIPMEEFSAAPLICPKQHAWEANKSTVETAPAFKALALLLKRVGSDDFQRQIGFRVFLEFEDAE